MAATQIKNSNLEDVIELVEQTVKSYLEEENV